MGCHNCSPADQSAVAPEEEVIGVVGLSRHAEARDGGEAAVTVLGVGRERAASLLVRC